MAKSIDTPVSPISDAPEQKSPRGALTGFLKYTVDTPDLEKAKAFVTRRTAESGAIHAGAVPPGATYTLGAEEADELGRIPVTIKGPPGGSEAGEMTVPMIVIQEDGQWKIDLPATMERMMGGMMNTVGQVMGEAMGAVGNAMATALSGVQEAVTGNLGAKSPSTDLPRLTEAAATLKKKAVAIQKKAKAAVKKLVKKAAKSLSAARTSASAAKKKTKPKIASKPKTKKVIKAKPSKKPEPVSRKAAKSPPKKSAKSTTKKRK